MANGVFHTGYGIKIELTHADLGHPGIPGLLEEITQPINQRERELLQCLEHHTRGVCQAEDQDRSPWMAIRRRTKGGRTTLVAAHLPVRNRPTAAESDKHKAMKERIVRAADRHGLPSEVEARSSDGKVRSDVLVAGAAGRIGWEAQYAPITASTVRRRSRAAAAQGIVPLWVTNSDRAALIDRAPWARVDDLPWQEITSRTSMLIRAGVRHLQHWKCTPSSTRACPVTGSACGRFHARWDLAALCLPQQPETGVDQLVEASADGKYVPMQVPNQSDPRSFSRMWVPAKDRDRWGAMFGPADEEPDAEPPARGKLTFTEEVLDHACRYGEETMVFNDRRPRRAHNGSAGLHTFDEVPGSVLRVPRQRTQPLEVTGQERQAAAAFYGCEVWEVGPCAGCSTPIHRYGSGSAHACRTCRSRVTAGR